jgi:hypothetical protein
MLIAACSGTGAIRTLVDLQESQEFRRKIEFLLIS